LEYGDVYVCVGTDKNVEMLKGRTPLFPEQERLYLVQAVRYVTHARLSSGTGRLDFEPDMAEIKPNYFFVCDDGGSTDKKNICDKYGVTYIEVPRSPEEGLLARSSTDIKKAVTSHGVPITPNYRICLAGGWIDQPFVSKYAPGSVVVFSILPTIEFSERAGLATSSRNFWKGELWEKQLFVDEPIKLARLLFGYENPPGSQYVSGSQDHLGLAIPGISRLYYDGKYWPDDIQSTTDESICSWLENVITLIDMGGRPSGYDPLLEQHFTKEHIALLGQSGNDAWDAILAKDIQKLGQSISKTHEMWKKILPLTTTELVEEKMNEYRNLCYGQLTSGAGGGGYLILVTDKDIPQGIKIKIRRK